jgi:hypothetical protein
MRVSNASEQDMRWVQEVMDRAWTGRSGGLGVRIACEDERDTLWDTYETRGKNVWEVLKGLCGLIQ